MERCAGLSLCLPAFLAFAVSEARSGESKAKAAPEVRVDVHGDPLPRGARARLGSLRFPLLFGSETAVAMHPTGQSYAFAWNRVISIVDTSSGKVLRRLQAPKVFPSKKDSGAYGFMDDLRALVFFDAGTKIIAAEDRGLRVWDLKNGRESFRIPFSFGVSRYAYLVCSPDGKLASTGLSVRIFDLSARRMVWQQASMHHGYPLAFLEQGKTLLTYEDSDKVCVRSSTDGKLLRSFKVSGDSRPVSSPDGSFLACAGDDGFAYLWRVATGKPVQKLGKLQERSNRFVFAHDGKFLAWPQDQGGLKLFDVATGKELRWFARKLKGTTGAFGYEKAVLSVALPNQHILAFTNSQEHKLRFWNIDADRERPMPEGHRGSVSVLSYLPDGRTLASGAADLTIRSWDVLTAKQKRQRAASEEEIEKLPSTIAPKHNWAAKFGGDNVVLQEIPTGKNYSVDVKALASSMYATVGAFSADGKTVACAGQAPKRKGQVILLETASGKKRLDVLVPDRVLCVGFSPDGTVLATGGWDGLVCLWDARSGALIREFSHASADFPALSDGPTVRGANFWVEAVAFSPDGRTLASGSLDTTILLWDVPAIARPRVVLSRDQLERLWKDLAGTNAEAAYRAIGKVAAAGNQAILFLRAHLHPAPEIDRKRVSSWLAELDSRQFPTREKATQELDRLGESADLLLRKALQEPRSLEAGRRLQRIVQKLAGPITSPSQLQALRAVEVLEHIGTPEAVQVLEVLSKGCPETRLTKEAGASLKRLRPER
jgi:WD40 repeat protein